jgi:hypothetical protein
VNKVVTCLAKPVADENPSEVSSTSAISALSGTDIAMGLHKDVMQCYKSHGALKTEHVCTTELYGSHSTANKHGQKLSSLCSAG